MKISVIVPTRNRPVELGHLLWSLCWQEHLPAQVIVVDQSEGADTEAVVDTFASLFKNSQPVSPELVYVHDPKIGGAGPARNVGIDLSDGDILVFLDDDEIVERARHEIHLVSVAD